MIGLIASGKSTRAEELVKMGNTVRLNKDLMREQLHFSKFTGINEGLTREASRCLAKMFLKSGTNVVIDDTNLNPKTLQSWVDLAKECDAKIQYERIDTPVFECVLRDAKREKPVGDHVIIGMALQYGLYDRLDKEVVLCDIDGTLAQIDHRLHYVKDGKKDWKGFFSEMSNDIPRKEIVDMVVKHRNEGKDVFIVSARPEAYRAQTLEWLEKAFEGEGYPYLTVFMRPDNDKRDDTEVKGDMYRKYFKDLNVVEVIDDRPRVIRMWRDLGLTVVDVGPGIEF